jgi:hypothetical protein
MSKGSTLIQLGGRCAKDVLVEIGGVEGAEFRPILADFGYLGAVVPHWPTFPLLNRVCLLLSPTTPLLKGPSSTLSYVTIH